MNATPDLVSRPLPQPSHPRSVAFRCLGWLVIFAANVAGADIPCTGAAGGKYPCGFAIESVKLQKVPPVFKFQARIAQSKLPVGEGKFQTVFAKVLANGEAVCVEQFSNVVVKDSVLNLSIGAQMSCELDEVVASNSNLQFQICLGQETSCLKPVALGTTPYAIKSSYANLAQNAHHADQAAVASYAYRITADLDLFLRQALGIGFFDFSTPSTDQLKALYPSGSEQYVDSAFVQWTPIRDATKMVLHIIGRTKEGALKVLDRLVLAAKEVNVNGKLVVTGAGVPAGQVSLVVQSGGANVTGQIASDSAVTTKLQAGTATVDTALNVSGTTKLGGPATVTAGACFNTAGTTTCAPTGSNVTFNVPVSFNASTTFSVGPLTVDNTAVHWTGNPSDKTLTLAGPLTVAGKAKLDGGLATTGASFANSVDIAGLLDVHNQLTAHGTLHVGVPGASGPGLSVHREADFNGAVSINGNGAPTTPGALRFRAGVGGSAYNGIRLDSANAKFVVGDTGLNSLQLEAQSGISIKAETLSFVDSANVSRVALSWNTGPSGRTLTIGGGADVIRLVKAPAAPGLTLETNAGNAAKLYTADKAGHTLVFGPLGDGSFGVGIESNGSIVLATQTEYLQLRAPGRTEGCATQPCPPDSIFFDNVNGRLASMHYNRTAFHVPVEMEGCRDGTLRGKICVTGSQPANIYMNAQYECAHQFSGHVCTMSEYYYIYYQGDSSIISNSVQFWMGNTVGDNEALRINSGNEKDFEAVAGKGDSRSYRCCIGFTGMQ